MQRQRSKSSKLDSKAPQLKLSWRQRFQLRAAEIYPGVKTRVVTALGSLGTLAVALQGYVTGIPANRYIDPEQLAVAGFVLFTLAYWTRSLSNNEPIS